jgi:hypothetical protein
MTKHLVIRTPDIKDYESFTFHWFNTPEAESEYLEETNLKEGFRFRIEFEVEKTPEGLEEFERDLRLQAFMIIHKPKAMLEAYVNRLTEQEQYNYWRKALEVFSKTNTIRSKQPYF